MSDDDQKRLEELATEDQYTYKMLEQDGAVFARAILELQRLIGVRDGLPEQK